VLLRENWISQVQAKELLFRNLLVHPKIKAFRSAGLLIALEFDSFATNKKVIDGCLQKGVLSDWFLFAPQCMRIAPPLPIREDEIHMACEIILQAIQES
jgi:acetylornithine/N-succinyldiaminopimelate aminotransferase